MKTIEARLDECERRLIVLEKFREKDKEESVETKGNVSKMIARLEDLIKSVDILPENLEKLMEKNFLLQQQKYSQLESMTIKNTEDIEVLNKKLDERTVVKDSQSWGNLKWLLVAESIGIVVLILRSFLKI